MSFASRRGREMASAILPFPPADAHIRGCPARTPAVAARAAVSSMPPRAGAKAAKIGCSADQVYSHGGVAVFSPALCHAARTRLGDGRLRADRPLTDKHRQYLAWHATRVFVRRPISS